MRAARLLSRAFTLVELLVVVSIIALLIGILIPSLAAARQSARATVELAAGKSLAYGYQAYTVDNKGSVLPGFSDPGRIVDDTGREMPRTPGYSEIRKRYPWRLLPWVDNGVEGSLLVNDQRFLYDRRFDYSEFDFHYGVSLSPNLGLNSLYLGGDARFGPTRAYKPLTKVADAAAPSKLLVFASARGSGFPDLSNGYFFVRPPLTQSFDREAPAAAYGFLDPRWSGGVVAAMLDGHAERMPADDLNDRRLWSDQARRLDDPNLRP